MHCLPSDGGVICFLTAVSFQSLTVMHLTLTQKAVELLYNAQTATTSTPVISLICKWLIPNLHRFLAVAAAAVTPAPARPQVAATSSGPLAEAAAAAAPAAIPDQAPSGQSSLFSADVAPAKLKPGVYARGRHTQEVATAQLAKVTGGTR